MSTRNGTDVDAAFAMKTFSDLGYKIKVATDQTVKQMKSLMLSGNWVSLFSLLSRCYQSNYNI